MLSRERPLTTATRLAESPEGGTLTRREGNGDAGARPAMKVETEEAAFIRRLAMIPAKARGRGARWVITRALEEFRTPTSSIGIAVRNLVVGAMSAFVLGLTFPVRLFTVRRDTIHLFYDLDVSPITFDLCFSLVSAEITRLRAGARSVHVVIVPGRSDGLRHEPDDYEHEVDAAERKWRIRNLLTPLCWMLPSVDGLTICESRGRAALIRVFRARSVFPIGYWPAFPRSHHPRYILDAARGGLSTRPLRASPRARTHVERWLAVNNPRASRVVTVTLRSYGFMPERNSDIPAWGEFARWIAAEGFLPVVIPDTAAAFDTLPRELAEFAIFREAAWNMELRAGLHEAAWLNMAISNGPPFLAVFSDVRYIMFKIVTESAPMASSEYLARMGYEADQTPPFAGPFQKWVWGPDDIPTLKREFTAMRLLIEKEEEPTARADP